MTDETPTTAPIEGHEPAEPDTKDAPTEGTTKAKRGGPKAAPVAD